MKFPSKDEITKVLEILDKKNKPSIVIDAKKASHLENMKHSICEMLIKFKRNRRLKTKELAVLAKTPETRISEILHYKVSRMTLDKLMVILQEISKSDKELRKFVDDVFQRLENEIRKAA